jgi:hypothetical protein
MRNKHHARLDFLETRVRRERKGGWEGGREEGKEGGSIETTHAGVETEEGEPRQEHLPPVARFPAHFPEIPNPRKIPVNPSGWHPYCLPHMLLMYMKYSNLLVHQFISSTAQSVSEMTHQCA